MIDMTCATARQLAAEFALDILEPEERSAVAAHLLRCPSCRAEVASMEVVSERLLDLVPGTEPPLGFDRRVLARVHAIPLEDGGEGTPAGGALVGGAGSGAAGSGAAGSGVAGTGRAAGSGQAGAGAGEPESGAGNLVGIRGFVRRRPRVAAAVAAMSAAAAVGFGSIGWMAGHTDHSSARRAILTAAFRQGNRDVGEIYAYAGRPEWLDMTVNAGAGAGHLICEVVQRDGSVHVLGSFDLVGGNATWGAPDPAGIKGLAGVRLVDSRGNVVATATVPN